nr:lipid-binding SYLF domain-containing protein [uncultured Rhodopila sp.]
MIRYLATAAMALLTLQTACSADAPGEQQTLVDRAALTVSDMMTQTAAKDPKTMLRKAKGVFICPRNFRAAFFFAGSGGHCVLLSRAGNGTWSYPAFFTIVSGGMGFQFGIEDNELLLLVLTDKGLDAVIDHQFKFGADASIAVATFGAGINGSTTAAVGADIVAYTASRGLYGGIGLEGSSMSTDTDSNQRYYGQAYAARQIVVQMQGSNPGADPLRDLLTKYGSSDAGPGPAVSPPQQQQQQQQPGYAPAYPSYPQQGGQPTPLAPGSAPAGGRPPVQEQNLTPPSR